MPTKRQFDMTVITVVMVLLAARVARLAAYRWSTHQSGITSELGPAISTGGI